MIKIIPLVDKNQGNCKVSSWMDNGQQTESWTRGCYCKMCWKGQYDRAIEVLGHEISVFHAKSRNIVMLGRSILSPLKIGNSF